MNQSVLIVEDETPTRAAFACAMGNAGWEVIEAADGAAALLSLARTSVSVILLDLRLPDMNGFEVLERAAQISPPIELPLVVVVSAYIDAAAWPRFFELPISVMIPKPIDPSPLPSLLQAVIDRDETALASLPGTTRETLHVYVAGEGPKRRYIYRRPADRSLDMSEVGQPVTRLR